MPPLQPRMTPVWRSHRRPKPSSTCDAINLRSKESFQRGWAQPPSDGSNAITHASSNVWRDRAVQSSSLKRGRRRKVLLGGAITPSLQGGSDRPNILIVQRKGGHFPLSTQAPPNQEPAFVRSYGRRSQDLTVQLFKGLGPFGRFARPQGLIE